MLKQVEPTVESPDQLLQQLELELAARRGRRLASGGQRATIIAGGLLLVMTGATVALFFLFTMLSDLSHKDGEAGAAPHTASSTHP